MNNTVGNCIKMTLFGESHGKYIGAVVDGLPAGIPVREEDVAAALAARRPSGSISTARREADEFVIAAGAENETGADIVIPAAIPARFAALCPTARCILSMPITRPSPK